MVEDKTARTINARDYKGLCNEDMNGVVVIGNRPSGGERNRVIDHNGLHPALTATDYKQPISVTVPVDVSTTEVKPMEVDEPCRTLLERDYKGIRNWGGTGAMVKIRENVKKGYSEATLGDGINLTAAGYETRRGRIGKGVAQTLDTGCNQGVLVKVDENTEVYAVWNERAQSYIAIRKLTPRECFRLQGWTDDYYDKAAFVNSDTQLYRQAGNGITTTVVKAIADMINEVEYES